MKSIIFVILLGIFLFISLGLYTEKHNQMQWRLQKKQWFSLCSLLILVFGLFTQVPANSVGILYSPFKGVSDNTLSEGFHMKGIFDNVYKINTEVQSVQVENLTTQTKDAQFLNSTLDVKYKVDSTNAYVIFKQFRTLDNMSQILIVPTTQRVLELITTKYNVIDILGEKRSEIYSELNKALKDEFIKYGIEFYSISIIDMDAGSALEEAITAEAVAKKSVETAEQNLLKAETEAKQKSVQAQAEQDAAKIQAQTKIIEAQAQKEANELLNQSLSDNVLRKEWIEKWNGQMPTYYSGHGSDMNVILDGNINE